MATIDVNAQAGADDDAKLTAAVAAASNGDTLSFTAKAAWVFAGNRTISKELTLLGDGKDVTTLTIKPTSSTSVGDRVAWYWNQDNTTFRDMQIKHAANASGHWAVWMMYMNGNPNNTLFQRVKFHNLAAFDYTEGATPADDGRWNTSYASLPGARGMYHAYTLYLGSLLTTPATHSVEFDSCEFHFAHCGIYMPTGRGGLHVHDCTFTGYLGKHNSSYSGLDGEAIRCAGHDAIIERNLFQGNDPASGELLNRAVNFETRYSYNNIFRENMIKSCGTRSAMTYKTVNNTTGVITAAAATQNNAGEAILIHDKDNEAKLLNYGGIYSPPAETESLTLAKTHNPLMIVDSSTTRTRAGYITNAAQDESYAVEVLKDDPIGFWKLDETSGTTFANIATKSSGAADDLTLAGTPTLDDSLVTGGITYKGVDFTGPWPYPTGGQQYAYAEQTTSWLPSSFPFCISLCVKMEEISGVTTIFALGNQQVGNYITYGSLVLDGRWDTVGYWKNDTSGSAQGQFSSGGAYSTGDVIHIFIRCVASTETYLYCDGNQRGNVHTGACDFFADYPFDTVTVNGIFRATGPTGYPTGKSTLAFAAVYDTDITPVRIAAQAAAFRKHWDLKLEGTASSVTAISNHGGYSLESDGTAANHADIGDDDTAELGVNFSGSILDDLGERRSNWNQELHGCAETAYTIVAAVSRDSYSDVDVIIANNAGTSTSGMFGATRTTDDGIELSILADDTVQFQHQGTTVVSTETITTDDTVVITARFDTGTMSIFVDGADKQDQAGAPSNLMSSGMTSIGVDAAQTGSGFDGRIGPIMVFPSALSDAEILALSDKILTGGAGGGAGDPKIISVTDDETDANPTVFTDAGQLKVFAQSGNSVGEWRSVTSASAINSDGTITLDAAFSDLSVADKLIIIGVPSGITIERNIVLGYLDTESAEAYKTSGVYLWRDGHDITIRNNYFRRVGQDLLISANSKNFLNDIKVEGNTSSEGLVFTPVGWWTYLPGAEARMGMSLLMNHNGEAQGGNADAPEPESVDRIVCSNIIMVDNITTKPNYLAQWRWPDRADGSPSGSDFGLASKYAYNLQLSEAPRTRSFRHYRTLR